MKIFRVGLAHLALMGEPPLNEMSVENWWDEISGRVKREKPIEKLTQTPFVHHETHMKFFTISSQSKKRVPYFVMSDIVLELITSLYFRQQLSCIRFTEKLTL